MSWIITGIYFSSITPAGSDPATETIFFEQSIGFRIQFNVHFCHFGFPSDYPSIFGGVSLNYDGSQLGVILYP